VNESSDGKDDGGEDEEVLRVEDAVKDVIGVDVVGGTGDDGKDIDVEGNCGIVGEDIVVGEEK
ncbi:9554_t:CDS:2, partial [Entrophospora sp. SA101]